MIRLALSCFAVLFSTPRCEEHLNPDRLSALYAKIDSEGDGKVSLDDLLQFVKFTQEVGARKGVPGLIAHLDKDGNGMLDLKEITKDLDEAEQSPRVEELKKLETQKFKLADVDGDGYLTSDEAIFMFHNELHDGINDLTVQDQHKLHDSNGDGKLSVEEIFGATKDEEKEKKLDKDGDGFITHKEFKDYLSGQHHTEDEMKAFLVAADADLDGYITERELPRALDEHEHHFHEWVRHHDL